MAAGSREGLIRQLAQKYGLDPNAVVAIAKVEGQSALYGGNSVGDHGTSFGPFQLHAGGALPKGKGNAWANSPAGIEYAVSHMGAARGLQGHDAIQAISQYFERPADVAGEVSKASGYYGKGGGRVPTSVGAGSFGDATRPNPLAVDPKAVIVNTLLQASTDAANGKTPDFGGILQMAQARQQAQAAHEQYGPTPQATGPLVGGQSGTGIKFSGGSLTGESHDFIGKVSAAAKAAGATQIRVSSGFRSEQHNAAVGGASESNHLTGHALDGEGFVPGKGWVPLGTLLAGVAPKFGLRSGATFNWGGTPDVVHVDDASNQKS
jgi:hypothetical protein